MAKRILKLESSVFSVQDVKAAYRKRALVLHPDTSKHGKQGDTKAFRQLQQCYEVALAAATITTDKTLSRNIPRTARTAPFRNESGEAWSEDQWMQHASVTFDNLQRAKAYDEEVREQFEREAQEQKARYQRHPKQSEQTQWIKHLRGGWLIEGWEKERLNMETGWKSVRTVRVRVTEPMPDAESTGGASPASAEGVTEEWIGDNGAPRQRTLVQLPRRFDLARKTFGQYPYVSSSECAAAQREFGAVAVALKRAISVFSGELGFFG